MNVEVVSQFLKRLSYRQAIWFAPAAYAIHILEESHQFLAWVNTNFAQGFTAAQFAKNNLIVMASLIVFTLLVTVYPKRWTALLHFLPLSAVVFHNALFHMATTAYVGTYSPGLLSAILLYLPLFYYITKRGYREGLLPNLPAIVVFILAGIVHVCFVYTQLFTSDLRL